ncbi:MAG: spore cortex biosynthesis protein YabQ [Acutalibacteraceae bacterium]
MPKVTNYDALTFFYCLLAGVALSLFADLLRALRKYLKLGKAAVFVTDLVFCIIAAILTFLMQFIYSNGTIRFYILSGELCGFLAARVAISPLINKLFAWIHKLLCLIIRPIKAIIATVWQKVSLICKKLCKKLQLFAKNILKSIGSLVYNIINVAFRRNANNVRKSKVKAERSRGKKKKKR